jgi:hypothetical protein
MVQMKEKRNYEVMWSIQWCSKNIILQLERDIEDRLPQPLHLHYAIAYVEYDWKKAKQNQNSKNQTILIKLLNTWRVLEVTT